MRGGTTEVLRAVISRGAVRAAGGRSAAGGGELGEVVDQVLAGHGDELPAVWHTVRELGWAAVGVDEERGGEGGDLDDVVTIAEGLGRHCVSVPTLKTILARRALGQGRPQHHRRTREGHNRHRADCRWAGHC